MKKIGILLATLVLAVLAITSCQFLQDVTNQISNLQRIKFKINNVNNFNVSGIDISNKKAYSDFSAQDILKFTSALQSGKLPTTFTINVDAQNPNTGLSNTLKAIATISSMPWDLYIDNKLIVSGNISNEILLPTNGSTITIPLQVNTDLVSLYKNDGISKIVNVALALGGMNKTTSNLKIIAQPAIRTPLGIINYPKKITIVDKTWSE